ncbi:MAG: sigma-54-dependent Fis family transcriptional regulator [Deltaproteobacteria bacterium]|nr:sigma-54-dependent Fis family transcriptional regulator [Deltaproteobacteria bacterium]
MTENKGHVVVVDDDAEMRALLRDYLVNQGYRVTVFPLASEALKQLQTGGDLAQDFANADVDLIVSDIRMPQIDGMEFAERLRKVRPQIPVILITAFGSIESAIEATRRGAYDYVVKPFKLAEMGVTVARAVEYRTLQRDNTALRKEIKRAWSMGELLGKSFAMKSIFDLVQRVSQATANVLITGESGTGKETVARAIHGNGLRKGKPFVAINCTAIPENLLESELFGHAKGSSTGAARRKRGLFEEAEGGTLFLDEIGDMNVSLQAKLLRVIQEKRVREAGDNVSRDIDVRIIAATHKDLKAAIREGLFRDDLYYRLSVIPIMIPPLRHRKEDIPLLAEHFLRKYSAANGSRATGFTKAAMSKLVGLHLAGNVRELENIVERAVVLCATPMIDEKDIPVAEQTTAEDFFGSATEDSPTLEQLEKRYIQLILGKTAGRKDKAAQILGINRRTLYRKEREYGLVRGEHDGGGPDVQDPDDSGRL